MLVRWVWDWPGETSSKGGTAAGARENIYQPHRSRGPGRTILVDLCARAGLQISSCLFLSSFLYVTLFLTRFLYLVRSLQFLLCFSYFASPAISLCIIRSSHWLLHSLSRLLSSVSSPFLLPHFPFSLCIFHHSSISGTVASLLL